MANPTQVFRRDTTWEKGVMRNLASQLIAHAAFWQPNHEPKH